MENLDLKIQVQAEIILPDIPTEIKIKNGNAMKIVDMSENSLRKIADAWKKALLEKAGKAPADPAPSTKAGSADASDDLPI